MKKLFTKLTVITALLFGLCSFAIGQRTVTGVISDAETNEPLIGANVIIKDSGTGTITDIDGSFTLEVPDGTESLVISYTGYIDQVVLIGADNTISVALAPGALLDEVVVVGYGTQKQKEVTGSVVSVKAEDFNTGNVVSPAQLLQGKVAGLTVSKANGDPNGGIGIRLRGLSTIGAQTNPLIIVDGVPGASLSSIDPQDIESMDVLKDGSASAIYGTRGSSGVILITTKKGKKGTSNINYTGYISTENIARTPSIATREEFLAAGGIDAGGDTDWYDAISQAGFAQSHNLSLSGGNEKTTYRASFNFRENNGVVKNTGFDQLNGSLSLTQKALDDKLSVSLNYTNTNRKSDFGFPEAFRYATVANPTSEIFNEDGTYREPGGFDNFNPVAMVEQNIIDEERSEVILNATATYNILPALKITGTYAKQTIDRFGGEYYPRNALYRQGQARNGVARRTTDNDKSDLLEATLQYTGESGNISYTVLGGVSQQEFRILGQGIEAGGYLNDLNTYNQIGLSSEVLQGLATPYSYNRRYQLAAQFGRATLNMDDKYFLSASVRREGSDRVGPSNTYGIFPAVSAGVDISKLTNISGVENLKLRLGYGVTGNLPGLDYLPYSIFGQGAQFFYNGAFVPSYGPINNANEDLKWEKKTEINVGLDYTIMSGKLYGSFDVFSRQTDDLLLPGQVSVPPNFAPITWDNIAAFTTNGIELALNYKAISTANFSYTPTLIFTSYATKLDKYIDDRPREFRTNLGAPGQNITDAGVGLHLIEEGEAIGQIVAPVFEGVSDEGAFIFKDQNGDGEINADDWIVVGNGLPDFELSLNNDISFGNWDVNVLFRGAFGHSLVNTYRAFYETTPDIVAANFISTDKGTPGVKSASYNSTHVEDASFVKLDNASIGYTFSKLGSFRNARVYVAGQNLLVFTGYTGVDPEAVLSDAGSVDNGGRQARFDLRDPLAPGVDRRNNYFSTRTITFGVNLGF
ncbi:MAG: SusC/RagA family TonB-linked outer membrane protein [Saprospiraceae bacterium]|nr:SusC/RagA family TonB-linked outer membrane protein [Saprospiraceae bacterium]